MVAARKFQAGIEREFARNGLRKGARLAGAPWKGVLLKDLGGSVEIKAANPAHLFNNPTSPRFIVAAGVGGSRSSRAARLGGTASRTVSRTNTDGVRVRYTERSTLPVGPVLGTRLFNNRRGKSARLKPGRTGGKQALSFGGNHPVLYARHPGTRGRRSFGPGRDRTRQEAADAYLTQHRAQLRWGA